MLTVISHYPSFSEEKLLKALRKVQDVQTTFPKFLLNSWNSGIVKYEINFIDRYILYYSTSGEEYKEMYPSVKIK
ncbi:DUF1398 domain-containing protein [Lactococcus garvieae]|uniref:hypothetical protein n=1 Tax=Lactococcus garvieae TaxID=1363 RepID=UPI0005AA05B8|nr:hypothetical protein [Lactococcus garvieae]MDG6191870.1 hypothetical protein [Lactococcus garvieae]QPR49701.1 hypothetical protein I6G86_04610 [Lactococcus garvieae]